MLWLWFLASHGRRNTSASASGSLITALTVGGTAYSGCDWRSFPIRRLSSANDQKEFGLRLHCLDLRDLWRPLSTNYFEFVRPAQGQAPSKSLGVSLCRLE